MSGTPANKPNSPKVFSSFAEICLLGSRMFRVLCHRHSLKLFTLSNMHFSMLIKCVRLRALACTSTTSATRTSGTKNLSRACQCSANNDSDTKVVRTKRASTLACSHECYTRSSDAAWVDGRLVAERRSEDRMHHSGAVSDVNPRLCKRETLNKSAAQAHTDAATAMSTMQV